MTQIRRRILLDDKTTTRKGQDKNKRKQEREEAKQDKNDKKTKMKKRQARREDKSDEKTGTKRNIPQVVKLYMALKGCHKGPLNSTPVGIGFA